MGHIYHEVSYIVGVRSDTYDDVVEFFPVVVMDGETIGRPRKQPVWTAPCTDPKLMSLAYGASQARCDQENAALQDSGMNRVREVL